MHTKTNIRSADKKSYRGCINNEILHPNFFVWAILGETSCNAYSSARNVLLNF